MKLVLFLCVTGLVSFVNADIFQQCGKSCNCYDIRNDVAMLRSSMCQAGISQGKYVLSSSSNWGTTAAARKNHGSDNGRLNKNINSAGNGGWSAATNTAGQWIQADLGQVNRATGVILQGRNAGGQYITTYKVQYSMNNVNFMDVMENGASKVFIGNMDENSWSVQYFPMPVYARYVRIVALTWNNHISCRMEVLTC